MNDWRYRFEFPSGERIDIDAFWTGDGGVIEARPGVDALPADLRPVTRLDCDQCTHCPLSVERSPLCPLAASVIPVTHRFDGYDSTESVHVIARSDSREVHADTPLQRGLGSLLGLLMGGSACPHFAFLRPLAASHLPFSDDDDTFFRVIGNALLQRAMDHRAATLEQAVADLRATYDAIGVVNQGMARRLRRCATSDSGVNAVIVLDMFARLIGDDPEEYIEALRPWYR